MKDETRKKIKVLFDVVVEVLVIFAVILAVFLMVADKIDKKVKTECKSCNSKYSWCPEYWKETNRCGYLNGKKTGAQ